MISLNLKIQLPSLKPMLTSSTKRPLETSLLLPNKTYTEKMLMLKPLNGIPKPMIIQKETLKLEEWELVLMIEMLETNF